jgi:hypothetical protein
MTPDEPELEAIGHVGRVGPPDPAVLDAARELLWAAVAAEMLSAGEAESHRKTDHKAEGPRQAEHRPAADPGA